MKKLFTLVALSFILLQSCTQDELEVAPQQVTIPTDINIASAAKAISESFVLSGAKAILLKPVDADPNTHLTTLFYADAQGKISPLLESFEVKQVEVTSSGIYVLTNYTQAGEPIAFFVRYDNSWVQLKGVGDFQFIIDNGDVVFTTGSGQQVLNTRTLKLEQGLENAWGHIGNIFLRGFSSKFTFSNITNGESQVVNLPEHAMVTNFIPLQYDAMVLIDIQLPNQTNADHRLLNMKTGEIADVNLTHEDMYRLSGSAVPNAAGDGIIYLSQGTRYWEYSALWSGLHYTEVVYKGTKVEEVKHDKFYGTSLPMPTPAHLVALNALLVSGYHYKVVENLVYYTGVAKTGKPATGVYDMISKENIIVDDKETYSSVNPL